MLVQNYFDNAAATPLLAKAKKAMEPYFSEQFYNPSALYLGARDVRLQLEEARHTIAKGIGAKKPEIIFTAGGTEANNLAINGILSQFKDAHVVISPIEHDSVIEPAEQFSMSYLEIDSKGMIKPKSLQKVITDETVLVSTIYVSNEIGAIQPLSDIHEEISAIRLNRSQRGIKTPLYWHIDACQAANYLDLQVGRLKVDLMTINSGKIYGPKQLGFLYVRTGIQIAPLIRGGGQEKGRRSGSENVANIVGFASAWKEIRANHAQEARRLSGIRDECIKQLEAEISNCTINGPSGNRRIANNIHLTILGIDNERILMELDEYGFQVATGSACSASSDEPSHVLKAIGLSDNEAQSSIRITMGRFTTKESAELLTKTLIKVCNK